MVALANDDFRIRVIDDKALVQSRCRVRAGGSGTGARTFDFTDVWRREPGHWRIGLRHAGLGQS